MNDKWISYTKINYLGMNNLEMSYSGMKSLDVWSLEINYQGMNNLEMIKLMISPPMNHQEIKSSVISTLG